MKYIKKLEEKKPKGAPDWHDSDAPDANGRFRDLSPKKLAAWLIKTRNKDVKKISGSLTQQVVFNRNDDPEYAKKMERTRKEVYKQLGREDLLARMDEAVNQFFYDDFKKWAWKLRAKINRMDYEDQVEFLSDEYMKRHGKWHRDEHPDYIGAELVDLLQGDKVIKESLDGLDNAKYRLENVYKHLGVEYGKTRRGDKYVQINYIPISRPQSQYPEWVKVFYDNDKDLKKIGKELGMDLKESVKESEASDEMAYGQLEKIIDYAKMIRQRLENGEELDDWMYGKIIKSEDYLNTLADVIDGDDGVIEKDDRDWNDKRKGPHPYTATLSDEDEEDKEKQMKKQAEMDDDDPDAYKEMPGDKKARQKGKVKTSKHVKRYHDLYGESVTENKYQKITKKIAQLTIAARNAKDSYDTVQVYRERIAKLKQQLKNMKSTASVNERFNESSFRFGKKKQFSYDDINVAYGFWGTMEMSYDEEQVSIVWEDAFDMLTGYYKFSDAAALYYLNSKAGRHLADKFAGGEFYNMEDTMDDYAKDGQWKKWAKEYEKYTKEEMAESLSHVYLYEEFLTERAAPAKRLFKDIVKGATSSIEGQKISKEMAQAALDWFDRSMYARKYSSQVQKAGMGAIAPLIFSDSWGIKKKISSKLKDEFKKLQDYYKRTLGESFEKANKLADDMFGEFGIANLSSKEMKEIIDMKKADRIAKKKYGEFGFATLAEEEMEKVLNDNPELVKEGVMSNIHLMIDASKDFEDFKKKFKKDYKKVFQNTPDFMDWLYDMYKEARPVAESFIGEGKIEEAEQKFKRGDKIEYKQLFGMGSLQDWTTLTGVVAKVKNKRKSPLGNLHPHQEITLQGGAVISPFVHKDIKLAESVNEEKAKGDRGPIDDKAIETGLKKKADETGVPIGLIRIVMRRGMAAWKTGHRPGATQQQWGYARVNSFLTKQKGTWGGADSDVAKEVRDGGHDKGLKS